MEHVIESSLTPARWQPAADIAAAAAMVVLIAVMGVVAAVMVGAVPSVVLATLVGVTTIVSIPLAIVLVSKPQN